MTNNVISSINLCPINFEAFGAINKITENIEATLLFSKIKFHQKNSVIEADGKTWIIRSRKQLAEWFQFTEKKIDTLISLLCKKGLIQKTVKLWHGKKALMLHASTEIIAIPIHHQKLSSLIRYIGDLYGSIIFSKIAFHFNNSQIIHDDKKWCSIKKEVLSSWAGISIRKLDGILEGLIKSGILLKKNFIWHGKRQTHFYIPTFATEVLYKNLLENNNKIVANGQIIPSSVNSTKHIVNTDSVKEKGRVGLEKVLPYPSICLLPPAKKGISIRIRSNTKKTNNNTAHENKARQKGDINFMTSTLSFKQERYLKVALENTIQRTNITISNPNELFEELKFSVTNINQHKSVHSFQHAVSRCMKIITHKNWKTPKGFYKYSNTGATIKEKSRLRETIWEKQKYEEKITAQKSFPGVIEQINSHATEQGIRLAKQVLTLKNTENNILASAMISQIHHLISQGANGKMISEILRNTK